jgi:hypothetical protein
LGWISWTNNAILECHNKGFNFLDGEGNPRKINGIPREIPIREISTMQLKKSYRKGCQIFVAHMEERYRDKVSNIEDHVVLNDFGDVYKEIPGLPPIIYIDFSINMMPRATPLSKNPYMMSTPEPK